MRREQAPGQGTRWAGIFDSPAQQFMLLWDQVRMDAYQAALERCAPGNVLVELGSGHGVLACLAARAGARRVYAIEEADIIGLSGDIARANHLDDRIEFIKGNSLNVEVPEPADVVYFDLMGADPLGAGMVVYAHDAATRFLKAGGAMVPRRVSLLAVGVESGRIAHESKDAGQWVLRAEASRNLYGLDLSPLVESIRSWFARSYTSYRYKALVRSDLQPHAEPAADRILTGEAVVAVFDLGAADPSHCVEVEITLPATGRGTLNGVATSCLVDLDGMVSLSSSPFSAARPTSWGGQFVSTLDPIEVEAGAEVRLQARIDPTATPAITYRRPNGPPG